jgi:hypothetical protein
MTPLLNSTNGEQVESNEKCVNSKNAACWCRYKLVHLSSGSVSDILGYAYRPERLRDANDRRCGGGHGRQNTPIRQLKGEQRMAVEEKLVRMMLIVYSSLYHHVVCF